jgi:acylphosphatase
MTSVRVVVSGRVQGVWFRAWTKKQAKSRGLSGWVRNLNDGTVEVGFSGADETVTSMFEACKTGPPLARVERVDIKPRETPADGFSNPPDV